LEPGLKRSIDKAYEIVVYALFAVLVDQLGVKVCVSSDPNSAALLKEFDSFAEKVIGISAKNPQLTLPARLNRVGLTNAADRGLDMWSNFGPAVQIKHLALDEELAGEIVESVSADRIVIVCKSAEAMTILSVLNQVGWKARIQSIITEDDLSSWYDKALRGKFSGKLGVPLMKTLVAEFKSEFPSTDGVEFEKFFTGRGYDRLKDAFWNVTQND
jgi:type II restriction enzyme